MKTLFLSAALALLTMAAKAQQKVFTFGAEGGISIASLDYDNKNLNDIYESRTGYAAGLALQYNFPKIFSLHSGAMFEMKGNFSKMNFTDINGNITGTAEIKRSLSYLTIPLLLRATFGNKINIFVEGGPYWAALLNATFDIDPLPANIVFDTDIKYQFEPSEFGVSGGIGVSSIFNNMIVLSIEVRTNMGITDIAKDTPEVKSRSLLFLAGVALTLGKRDAEAK